MLSKLRAIFAFLHSAIYVIALVVGVVILALFIFSKTPENTDDHLVSAFVEMRVAEQLYGGDSPMGRLVRRDVLKKYGYTREEFLKATDELLEDETFEGISFAGRFEDMEVEILEQLPEPPKPEAPADENSDQENPKPADK